MGGGGKGGGKGSKPVTVGYRYYWDIHSGICRGPVDEVVEVRFDNKTAYSAIAGEITTTKAIYIFKPDLFGGDDTGGEGGIVGRMEILMGEADQLPSVALSNLLNGVRNPEWGPVITYGKRQSKGRGIVGGFLGPGFAYGTKKNKGYGWASGDMVTDKINSWLFPDKHTQFKRYIDPAMNNFAEVPTKKDDNAIIPGFRGIVTSFFSGMVSAFSAYPKKHSYRLRRTHSGWRDGVVWYPEKCRIILRNDVVKLPGLTEQQAENARLICAMNPAHILVECATNKSWGGKKELSDLDIESYTKAADTLFSEGFGLCFRYNRQSSIKEFVQQILDHIGGVQYDNLETGKLALKLIRQDYNSETLPLFTYDNGILKVLDDDTPSTDNAANQVIVTYLDPVTNKTGQATANNLASIQMHGVISKNVEYKGLPTFDLAARVAQRDLEMTSSGVMRLKIVFDMRGSELKPGDVFRVHLPDRGIEQTIMRVGALTNGNEGEIVATCFQDVFGLPAANYSTTQSESYYTPPDYSAKPITAHKLFEVPYCLYPLMLDEANLALIKPTDCYIGALAANPGGLALGYSMQVDSGAGFNLIGDESFTPSILLLSDITPYQTTIKYKFNADFADLSSAEALMIDDEIVKIESVDYQNSTLTIGRGCGDTVPQAHKAGARGWCYILSAGGDSTKYTVNEQLKVKLLTRTAHDVEDEDKAQVLTLTTRQRQARPYPPGKVQIDGGYGNTINDKSAFKLTWAHRDRDVQADKLIPHTDDSTVLGKDVSYKVDLLDGNTVVRSINTTATEFVYPDAKKVDGEQFSQMALYSVKNGLQSLHRYVFKVGGAMTLLHSFNYQARWTSGDNVFNRYNDGDFGGLGYLMLGASSPNYDIYNDYTVSAGQYARFVLDYKILTYKQRSGKCKVIVQLLNGTNVVQSYESELMGDWPTDDWHPQQVSGALPPEVTTIRFKIVAQPGISSNALTFRDITIRVGEE